MEQVLSHAEILVLIRIRWDLETDWVHCLVSCWIRTHSLVLSRWCLHNVRIAFNLPYPSAVFHEDPSSFDCKNGRRSLLGPLNLKQYPVRKIVELHLAGWLANEVYFGVKFDTKARHGL